MRTVVSLFGAWLAGLALTPPTRARDPLVAAAAALGVDAIHTLQFSGTGAEFSIGQNFAPDAPWPRVPLTSFTVLVNYQTASIRLDLVRAMGERMPRGGGVPFIGEQHEIETVSGTYAWDTPVP